MSCSLYPDAEKDHQRRFRIAQRLNVRPIVRFPSSLAAALLDGLFAHPAWPLTIHSYLSVRTATEMPSDFSVTCYAIEFDS